MQGLVQGASSSKLIKTMRFTNFINALLLACGGVFVFIPVPTTISPILILSAVYVFFFSMLLCCFECHISRFDVAVAKYFGFMFTWQGRCLFFLFNGLLSFGLGWVGIAAGIVTILNVIFNIYVLRINTGSRMAIEAQQNELRAKAMQGVTIDMASLQRDAAQAALPHIVNAAVSSAAAPANPAPAGGDAPGNPWRSM